MIQEPYVGQLVTAAHSPSWRGVITEIVYDAEPRFPELFRVDWEFSGYHEIKNPLYARTQLNPIEPLTMRDAVIRELLAAGVSAEADDDRVFAGQVADRLISKFIVRRICIQCGVPAQQTMEKLGYLCAEHALDALKDM